MAKGQQLIDITGNTYNYLKVLSFSHIGGRRRSYWSCQCLRCGTVVTLRKDAFAYKYSKVKSCGCWHPEESRLRAYRAKNKINGKFEKR